MRLQSCRRGIFVSTLVVILAVSVCEAQGPGAKGAATGDGSTAFTGLAQAPEANLFVGASTTSIQVEVPSGRGKLTPKVALAYSSSGGAGPYGFGWDLPLGSLQRSVKHGTLSCEDNTHHNDFVLALPGTSIECIRDTGTDYCKPTIEEAFLRIKYLPGNQWAVWDKSGTRYSFGQTTASRLGSNTSQLFTAVAPGGRCAYTQVWLLSRIEDLDGNYIEISYANFGGNQYLYPSKIEYGGNSNSPGGGLPAPVHMFEVAFSWSNALKIASNGLGGFNGDVNRLLKKISVNHRAPQGGSWTPIRSYQFSYSAPVDPNDPRPDKRRTRLLESVTLLGSHGLPLEAADGPAATTFKYHEHNPDDPNDPSTSLFKFGPAQKLDPLPISQPNHMRIGQSSGSITGVNGQVRWVEREIMDVNGDGIPDLVDAVGCTNSWTVYPGTNVGFATHPSEIFTWSVPFSCNQIHRSRVYDDINGVVDQQELLTIDINGDGVLDRVQAQHDETGIGIFVPDPWRVWYGRRPDPATGAGWRFESAYELWVNTPSSFLRYSDNRDAFSEQLEGTATIDNLIDVTGDGRADLVHAFENGSGIYTWTVYPNEADGFGPSFVMPGAKGPIEFSETGGFSHKRIALYDINGDGLPDQIQARKSNYPESWDVYINRGTRFDETPTPWQLPQSDCGHSSISMSNGAGEVLRDFFDLNGDGLPDAIDTCGADDSGNWTVYLNSGFDFAEEPILWEAPTFPNEQGQASHFVRDASSTRTVRDSIDIDGDGFVDFVDFQTNIGPPDYDILIFRNAAGAWCPSSDGASCAQNGGPVVAPNPDAGKPYLLSQIRNGIGGTTLLDYRPSTDSPHEDFFGVPQLPFTVWTLTGITRQDEICTGLACPGHEIRSEFAYDHGKYNHVAREFRGFGTVERRDANDGVRQTFFHQDAARKGKLQRTLDGLDCQPGEFCNVPIHQTVTTWQCVDLAGQPLPGGCPQQLSETVWPRIQKTTDWTFSNSSWILYKVKETLNVSWHQCQGKYFGNVSHVQTHKLGDPVTVDTHMEYTCTLPSDSSYYVVDKPVHTWTESDGEKLEEKWFLYDGQAGVGAFSSPPRGNVTKVLSLIDRADRVIADDPNDLLTCPGGGATCVATTTAYDQLGNVTAVADANGHTTSTIYDATQIYTAEVTNPAGHSVATTYDPKCGVMTSQTIPFAAGSSPGSQRAEWAYDEFCRLTRVARPDEDLLTEPGEVYCYVLGDSYTSTTVRVLRREPSFTCPGCSTDLQQVLGTCSGGTCSQGNCSDELPTLAEGYLPAWSIVDALGRPIQQQAMSVVDGSLTTVVSGTVHYDVVGRVERRYASYADPWARGEYSDPATTNPAEAGTTEFEYDSVGRVVSVTNPDSTTRTVDHTVAWQTTTFDECYSDPNCAGGKVVEIRDAFERVIERQLYEQDALKAKTRFVYDGLGRLLVTEQWDSAGWNPFTKITTQYDTLGRKVSMTDPDTGPTSSPAPGEWKYWYDAAGNLRVQDDPTDPQNSEYWQHIQFCYDAANRLTRKYVIDTVDYSSSNNLIECGLPETAPLPPKTTLYRYDDAVIPNGVARLSSVRDPSGETFFDAYDVRGRVTEYRKQIHADDQTEEAKFFYAYNGDQLETLTYPDMEQVRYEYDEAGRVRRLFSLSSANTIYLADMTYDRFGRPRQISHGNTPAGSGTVVADIREYGDSEKNFRLKRITVQHSGQTTTAPAGACGGSGAGPYLNLAYDAYTATGLIKEIEDETVNDEGFPSTHPCAQISNDATYAYDGLGRLTAVTQSQFDGSYGYNELGNMNVKDGNQISYGNLFRPHQPTSALGEGISHDANGNRWNDGFHAYEFDEDDRLVGIDDETVKITYDYTGRQVLQEAPGEYRARYFSELADFDVHLGMLRKHYFVGSLRLATHEIYWFPTLVSASGWPSVTLAQASGTTPAVVLVLDERAQQVGGLLLVSVFLTLMFLPGRSRKAVGVHLRRGQAALVLVVWVAGTLPAPLSLVPLGPRAAHAAGGGGLGGPQSWHYHADHLGSAQVLTDKNGNVLQHVRYEPFGALRGRYKADLADISFGKRYEFTGYETEPYSGLQYAGARFYDPALGMFLTHDPARQFANPYAYGPWDPVNGTDPNGQIWFIPAILAAVYAAAAAYPVVTAAVVGGVVGGVSSAVTGQNILQGIVVGVGLGIVGGAAFATGNVAVGVTSGAAIGAAQSAAAGQNPLYGALIGAGFGAASYYGGNIPAVPGEGAGAYLANAVVEIGTEAGVGALRGGFTAIAGGGDFGEGAGSGAAFGAGFGAAKVAFLGARFDPAYSDDELKVEFIKQSLRDQSGLSLPPPDPSSVSFRTGGLLALVLGRSITLLDAASMHPSDRTNIQQLAHELRHAAQLRALGVTPFYAKYLYQSATRLDQFYQPGNRTLEPEYVR